MVADDNRRASDNLATRDYPSLQVVMPWAWMENVTCSSVASISEVKQGSCLLANIKARAGSLV